MHQRFEHVFLGASRGLCLLLFGNVLIHMIGTLVFM